MYFLISETTNYNILIFLASAYMLFYLNRAPVRHPQENNLFSEETAMYFLKIFLKRKTEHSAYIPFYL